MNVLSAISESYLLSPQNSTQSKTILTRNTTHPYPVNFKMYIAPDRISNEHACQMGSDVFSASSSMGTMPKKIIVSTFDNL